jgi:hypothetical protein
LIWLQPPLAKQVRPGLTGASGPSEWERQKDGGKKIRTGDFSAPILPVALSSSCCFQLSCADYGTSPIGPKTYGSVLGTIFFGGVGPPLVLETQWLAAGKIPKTRKNTKKSAK